jgi:hypothetical protein
MIQCFNAHECTSLKSICRTCMYFKALYSISRDQIRIFGYDVKRLDLCILALENIFSKLVFRRNCSVDLPL